MIIKISLLIIQKIMLDKNLLNKKIIIWKQKHQEKIQNFIINIQPHLAFLQVKYTLKLISLKI
jgi:hypothetical protein